MKIFQLNTEMIYDIIRTIIYWL